MPRTRSKRRDTLAQKLDFNDTADEIAEQRKYQTTAISSDCSNDGDRYTTQRQCPLCPCSKSKAASGTADCNCSSCSASITAQFTELRDDFCHRDRPRFVFYRDIARKTEDQADGKTQAKLHWMFQFLVVVALVLLFVSLLLCLKWVLVEGLGNLAVLWIHFEDFTDNEPIWLLEKYLLLGPVSMVVIASMIGTSCTYLSWNITYYDSIRPGIPPPRPLSPIRTRNRTRYVCHFGYIMALANGLAAFTLTWWWLQNLY